MADPVTATAPPVPNVEAIDVAAEPKAQCHGSTPSLASPRIAIHDVSSAPAPESRPSLAAHMSAPAVQKFQSPLRQHRRTPSQHREVKETLNARSEYTSDDTEGTTKHRINQYIIWDEIGRGSYGAVHLATDQFGNEYAVKEFSKTRLRKRAQSNILRRPQGTRPGRFAPGRGMRSPFAANRTRLGNQDAAEAKDALFLIREEIAIMKKLNHPNLVQLIEVLDDPEEDSLYMVLEMCKKGVVMKVGLDDQADPYPEESCRYWFRDLVLGIEYLHAQGILHRDIKPDNLLLTEDDVLKIVDFGVSEIFEKPDEMLTTKSTGSPAFLPPELCQSKHGDISGKAADVWSMGVSLYCMRYGSLPFKRAGILEMYDAIRTEEATVPPDEGSDFADLMSRLLDKNADTRITIREIRDHPWVTKGGADPLLSEDENCEGMLEPPNEMEVNHAFTRKMDHMLIVMMAIHKFKGLISKSRAATPDLKTEQKTPRTPKSLEVPAGVPETPEPQEDATAREAAGLVNLRHAYRDSAERHALAPAGHKGHAHELVGGNVHYLGIGTGEWDRVESADVPADVVSDSPTGIDFDVYERAFEDEVERIRSEKRGARKTTYLTKFVKEKEKYFGDECMIMEAGRSLPAMAANTLDKANSAAAKTLAKIGASHKHYDDKKPAPEEQEHSSEAVETKQSRSHDGIQSAKETGHKFAELVAGMLPGHKQGGSNP